MKKLLLTLAALPAATMAVEASAQTNMNANGAVGIQNRIMNLEARYNAGVQAGAFDSRERSLIMSQLNQLRSLERQYSANGLTRRERQTLQQRVRSLRDQMRMAGGNWANRYGWNDNDLDAYGNGYANSYGSTQVRVDQYGRQVDQYGRVIANNGYRTDQYGRTVDQYGRVIANSSYRTDQYGRPVDQYGRVISNGNYYGQGGPYEPVYTPRSSNGGIGNVLGGVLGSVVGGGGGLLGSILGNGGLNVGDLITGGIGSVLGGVPSNYSSQYQNRNDVYFRSDGQRVYEIDARTNTVIRVHPLRY